MSEPFPQTTAEHVVAVVQAVNVLNGDVDKAHVATFTDLLETQAEAALQHAVLLKLLRNNGDKYELDNNIARFFDTCNDTQRSSAMRIALEEYKPFVVFRQRLATTTKPQDAARQTKTILDLDAHHEEVKDTLISFGTYSQALGTAIGGQVDVIDPIPTNSLEELAKGCKEKAAAEDLVRNRLGRDTVEVVSQDGVIAPLAQAFICANSGDSRGAIQRASNAIEAFLNEYGKRMNTPVDSRPGVNAKADELKNKGKLVVKFYNVSKYLGHIRNAADHGPDQETGKQWEFREETGIEYVFVACSFIISITTQEKTGKYYL